MCILRYYSVMFSFLSRFLQRNVGQWTEFLQHFIQSKGMVQGSSKMMSLWGWWWNFQRLRISRIITEVIGLVSLPVSASSQIDQEKSGTVFRSKGIISATLWTLIAFAAEEAPFHNSPIKIPNCIIFLLKFR